MAIKGMRLGKIRLAQTVVASAEAVVTNPAGYDTCVDYIILYNSHNSAVTVTLCDVDDNAGSAGTPAATDVFFSQSLAANESVFLGKEDLGMWFNDTNDTLCAYASVADKVHVRVYGVRTVDQS